MVPTDLHDAHRLGFDLRRRSVELDQQDGARPFGIAGADTFVDGPDEGLVNHLERGRDDTRGHDGRDGFRCVVDRRIRGEQGLHAGRHVEEPHGDGRQQAERPLAAHERTREIVARMVVRLAAHRQDLPRTGDDLEPQHVVDRDAVLEAVRAAGVGGGVAADGGDHLAGGIGCEVVAVLARGLREPQVDEPRLDSGAAAGKVELEDSVHPGQRDHHATDRRHRAADEPRARAARHQGHVLAATETHQLRDLPRSLGQHHHIRRALVEGVHVSLIDHAPLISSNHTRSPNNLLELTQKSGTQRHEVLSCTGCAGFADCTGRREGSRCEAAPEGCGRGVLLYVEPAAEGANEADGPLSAARATQFSRSRPRQEALRCLQVPGPRWPSAPAGPQSPHTSSRPTR